MRFSEKTKDTILNTALIASLLLATGVFLNARKYKNPTLPIGSQSFSKGLGYITLKDIKSYEPLQGVETGAATVSSVRTQSLPPSAISKSSTTPGVLSYNQSPQKSQSLLPTQSKGGNLQLDLVAPEVAGDGQLVGSSSMSLVLHL